jgi:Rrf2 family protein
MLSQKAKYALRALLMLAERPAGEPLLIADIAARQNLPKKFLELILLDLKHHGLLHSKRGKHGGYALARSPWEISFGEVVRIVDGPLAQVMCVSQTAYRRCEDCRDEATCAVRKAFRRVRDATAAILDNHTLADANRRGHKGQRPVAS